MAAVKPSITILYDADEERVREGALAKGERFPALVSTQIDDVLTKRGYTVKKLAAVAPIKKLVRQLEDDNSELPPIEWDLSKLPADLPRIAGTEAKWENDFKESKEFVPQDIVADETVMTRIREAALGACGALLIRDYARIDMRLAGDGTPYVIEVNPNPWLDNRAEFAMAARRAKPELSHGDLIERIVQLAMTRTMRPRADGK